MPNSNKAPSQHWKQRLNDLFLADKDALAMRVFECAFTFTFLVWMTRCFIFWREWLTEEGFHLNAAELESMGYPAPWRQMLPWEVGLFAIAIYVSGTLLILNLWRRGSLITLFLCALCAQRVDFMAAFTLSKLFVGIYAILALAPAMWRHPETGRLMQSVAPIRVLQAMLMLQYCASGLAKAGEDWLGSNDVLWGQVQGYNRTEFAAFALRNLPMWAWTIQQYAALCFEIFAPVLFLVKRLRPVAFVLGIGMHVLITVNMAMLLYFQMLMISLYILWVPSEKWRAWGESLKRLRSRAEATRPQTADGVALE